MIYARGADGFDLIVSNCMLIYWMGRSERKRGLYSGDLCVYTYMSWSTGRAPSMMLSINVKRAIHKYPFPWYPMQNKHMNYSNNFVIFRRASSQMLWMYNISWL